MNNVAKKYIEHFNNSKSKRITNARRYLKEHDVKIEDLMKSFGVNGEKVLNEFIDLINNKNMKISQKDVNKYLKNAISTNTKKFNNLSLCNMFRSFKNGLNIQKGSIPQMLFGCGTCPDYMRDSCPHNGEHSNGGCSERYKKFAYFIQTAKSASIPQMEEHLAELRLRSLEHLQKISKEGKVLDKNWLALQKIITELEDKYHRALHGTKHKVSKDISIKDIRKSFYKSGSENISPDSIIDAEFENLKNDTKTN